MSERTRRYTEGEIGDLRVVEDFLPPPAELVLREDTVKVTPGPQPRGRGGQGAP